MLTRREGGLGFLYDECESFWLGGEHEHCKLITAFPDQQEGEVSSPVNHLSFGWQEGACSDHRGDSPRINPGTAVTLSRAGLTSSR